MHKRANTDALIHTLIWPFPWTGGRQRIRFLSRGLAANVFYLSAVWKNNKIHPGQDPDTICPSLGIGFWGCYLTLYLRLGFCWPVTCCFSQRRLPRVSHEWKQPLVGNWTNRGLDATQITKPCWKKSISVTSFVESLSSAAEPHADFLRNVKSNDTHVHQILSACHRAKTETRSGSYPSPSQQVRNNTRWKQPFFLDLTLDPWRWISVVFDGG